MDGIKVERELALGEKLSVINLVNGIIEHAYALRASDVHMDPGAECMRVRLRIDGMLQDVHVIPNAVSAEVTSRIKILAGLRTDEHQAAQDGRFRAMSENSDTIDIRVSIVPAYYGENVVLRLLADKAQEYTLEALGLSPDNAHKIIEAARRAHGMILATGPTGSGKTTTLYTILKKLNTKDVAIVTIEDPIEYAVSGIKQIQVNSRTALGFANGLKSILRQDPNIIMVGEIRDAETAGIAVNTALTGHLVLSTLHTNDAATTLPRLLDMKIEPYLIASTVSIVIGQRLVRKICESCKEQRKLSPAEEKNIADIREFFDSAKTQMLSHGKGCADCNQSGYRGRVGIYEVMPIDDPIREAMLKKCSASQIEEIAVAHGMQTMGQDGFEKAAQGITTLEEVLRVIHE